MTRAGNVSDNSAMESFFSSLLMGDPARSALDLSPVAPLCAKHVLVNYGQFLFRETKVHRILIDMPDSTT